MFRITKHKTCYLFLVSSIVIVLISADSALAVNAELLSDVPVGSETVGLGERLRLSVKGIDQLIADRNNLKVSIDGIEILGVLPNFEDNTTVAFDLTITDDSREPLLKLLRRPTKDGRNVAVMLMTQNAAIPGIAYVTLRGSAGIGWSLILTYAGIAAIFITASVRSNLLREPGPITDGKKRAFSLARVQFAWWLFVVLASYLFLYWVRQEPTVFGGSAFILLGISVGTTAGAGYVDRQKEATVNKDDDNTTDASRTTKKAPISRTFLQDILSNRDGAGMHRFQFFAWTVALGIIFLIESWRNLQMPTFGEELLALVGVSATAYVGMKMPEPPKQT